MRKLFISGMNCGHCESKVKNALSELGASFVEVNLENKTVNVEIDKTNEEIIDAISDYGFDVDNIEEM